MNNNNYDSNKPTTTNRLILEAILNDNMLQQINAKRVEIYSLATPIVILGKDGDAETIWIDETNHPSLPKINEIIEQRTEQIKQWFK